MVARKPHDCADAIKQQIKTLQRASDEMIFLISRCSGKERDASEMTREIRRNSILICRLAERVREIEEGSG